MTSQTSDRPARHVPWARLALVGGLCAIVLAPRGVSVGMLSDTQRPITFRVDVTGDTAVSPPIRPCWSDAFVVCPRGETSIRVTVDDGRQSATHDLDVYLEDRAVGLASVVVSQGKQADAPFEFEEGRFQPGSRFWSLFLQSLFVRGIVLGLAIGVLTVPLFSAHRARGSSRSSRTHRWNEATRHEALPMVPAPRPVGLRQERDSETERCSHGR